VRSLVRLVPAESSLLGHANPQITLTTYADEWATQLDQGTAANIAGVLFGCQTVAAEDQEDTRRELNPEESPDDSKA
jgi:hypothetical protein